MTRSTIRRAATLLVLSFAAFVTACGDDKGGGTAVIDPPASTGTTGDGSAAVQPGDAGGATTAPAGPQAAVAGDPMGVVIKKLDNGLTVMLSENHDTPRIATQITTRAGAAKDPGDSTGMAHYLEHMLFKGTTKMGTVDWEKEKPHVDRIDALYEELFTTKDTAERERIVGEIDKAAVAATEYQVPGEFDALYKGYGAQGINAFTSMDQTTYVVDIPANRLEQWSRVEFERFRKPVFRLFPSELEAVYEEFNRMLDNASSASYFAQQNALFPQHPYGTQTTIGTTEHLKNPSIKKMYEFFEKWYVPGNMCVAMAGDFDAEEALAIIENSLGKWEPKPVPDDPVYPIEKPDGVVRVEVPFEADETIAIAFLTVPTGHADEHVLQLCDMMLDNSQTGLINVNLGQTQAVRQAGSSPSFTNDAGYQRLFAIPKPGQTLDECEELLLAQVKLLKEGSFTDADLKAVITDFEVNQKRGLEGNQQRVQAMTGSFVSRIPWDAVVHSLDHMRTLTKADVVAAANKYFGDDYVVVRRLNAPRELPSVTKPKFTPVDTPSDRHSPWFDAMSAEEVAPIAPRFAVKDVDYQVRDFPWGRLYYARNPVNDIFDLVISTEFGTKHDKRLERAFNLMDLGGAGDLDPVAYKRKLYSLASSIGGGSGEQSTSLSASGLDANLEETLTLLRSHFQSPTGVGQSDLDKLVQRELGMRQFQKQQARVLSFGLNQYAMRGADSPLLTAPSNDDLKALQADDLIAAVKDVFKYKRRVTYVGQKSLEEVAALVAPPAGPALLDTPEWKPIQYALGNKNRVLFVNARAAQSSIGLFATDGVFEPARYPEGRLYNAYMSGGMGAVVFQEVREKRALAYAVGTSYQLGNRVGATSLMTGNLGTQPDKTIEAIEVLLGIIRDLPASELRVENSRKSLDNSYRTARLTPRQLPGAAKTWDDWGTGKDPREYNWKGVTSMSLDDLVKFASRFKDKPFTIAVAGPRDKVDLEALAQFGEVTEVQPDDLFNF